MELRPLTVAEVDANARTVFLDSGEELEFQKLLIATGGINRRLDIPGAGLAGIHQLRTVAECDAIKREAPSIAARSLSAWASSAARWPPR